MRSSNHQNKNYSQGESEIPKNGNSGEMPIDFVFKQRNTGLAMAKCIGFQEISFKNATFSLGSMEKCIALQKIGLTATFSLCRQDTFLANILC